MDTGSILKTQNGTRINFFAKNIKFILEEKICSRLSKNLLTVCVLQISCSPSSCEDSTSTQCCTVFNIASENDAWSRCTKFPRYHSGSHCRLRRYDTVHLRCCDRDESYVAMGLFPVQGPGRMHAQRSGCEYFRTTFLRLSRGAEKVLCRKSTLEQLDHARIFLKSALCRAKYPDLNRAWCKRRRSPKGLLVS